MPAALQVDREQVRMLVLSIGVRDAARQLGIAEGTVQAWSARGSWLDAVQPRPRQIEERATRNAATIAGTLQPPATKPSDALADVLADLSRTTRLNGAKAVGNALRHAAQLDGEEALGASRQVKDAIGGAAILHGWDRDGAGRVQVSIYAAGSVEKAAEVIEVETEVSSADSTE